MKLKSAGILTSAIIAMAATNANANALFDIYAGATVGVGATTMFANHENDTAASQAYGAVAGIDIPLLRVEMEYDFLNEDNFNAHVGMVNAYLKMPSVVVHPYLGVGAGMVFGGHADNDIDIKNTAAYQAMVGLTFDVPVLPFKIDGEARALYAPDIFTANDIKPDMLHYDLRVKLRYVF